MAVKHWSKMQERGNYLGIQTLLFTHKILGRKGLSYDAWHYHYQNQAFTDLARSVPETILVLDHFGTPLGLRTHYIL